MESYFALVKKEDTKDLDHSIKKLDLNPVDSLSEQEIKISGDHGVIPFTL